MKLSEHVNSAFADSGTKAYIPEFLTEIRSNWRDAENALRRSVALVLLMAFVFEIASRDGLGEFSIGGVKLTNTDVIRGVIPVVVAYTTSAIALLISESILFCNAHRFILEQLHPTITNNMLDDMLGPSNSMSYSHFRLMNYVGDSRIENGLFVAMLLRMLVILGLPIAFVCYAYAKLFSQLGFTNFWILSGSIIAFLLIMITITTLASVIHTSSAEQRDHGASQGADESNS